MPATSKRQQRFMGIVHAIQKGDLPPGKAHGEARDVAKTMSPADVTDFAETKRKGLPEKAKQADMSAVDFVRVAQALV